MLETPGRLRRLAEELEEVGIDLGGVERDALVEEVDRALRPPVHERRIPSSGSIVHPRTAPELWARETGLVITRASAEGQPIDAARRFADGHRWW